MLFDLVSYISQLIVSSILYAHAKYRKVFYIELPPFDIFLVHTVGSILKFNWLITFAKQLCDLQEQVTKSLGKP